jgi:hypothetical protein
MLNDNLTNIHAQKIIRAKCEISPGPSFNHYCAHSQTIYQIVMDNS